MVDAGYVTQEQSDAARGDMVSIARARQAPGHYFADWIRPGARFVNYGDPIWSW